MDFNGRGGVRQLLTRFYDLTNPGAGIFPESLDIYKLPVDTVHRQYHRRNRGRGRTPPDKSGCGSDILPMRRHGSRLSARVQARDDWNTPRNRMENKPIHIIKEKSHLCSNDLKTGKTVAGTA